MIKTKGTGLGKGLSAIFDIEEQSVPRKVLRPSGVIELELDKITPNPNQPRQIFEPSALEELSQSIIRLGVIQPITVRPSSDTGKYMIISGERRYRASLAAGKSSIPVYVRECQDDAVLELALVENIQREDLNAMEIAFTMQQLIEECNLTQEQLADRVGKKRSTVANYLRLIKLPAEVQLALRQDLISMGHARAMIGIEDEQQLLHLLTRIIKNELSVRQVEEYVKQIPTKSKQLSLEKEEYPQVYNQLRERIKAIIGRDINIKRAANGKGKIVINFSSDQEIDQILERLK